ncbi:MAG: hypothetical protein JST38_18060 [Bacteroidetes bacterium]|nr:hypothetical protein [Bacteroidota bacterium]MBS1942775.1 hypothetical protein [Bacteroidota bacterium]
MDVNKRHWLSVLPWVTAFAVAMGFLEAAVVVYLRAVAYPDGFKFPLAPLDSKLVITELLREAATLVMLLAPGALVSRMRMERFAWFCWAFAVWDLFYYVFLKLILGWPESWLTWDVLFLLPTVWVGPVLAPCMVSAGLMVLAVAILRGREHRAGFGPSAWQWAVLFLSGAIMLFTFMEEPVRYLAATAPQRAMGAPAMEALNAYVPQVFQWGLFLGACVLATVPLVAMFRSGGQPANKR